MPERTHGKGLSVSELQNLYEEHFAPWVKDLDLTVSSSDEMQVTMIMRPSERLNRQGGILSGQALMSAADTAMALAVFSASGEFRPSATVDMHTSFLKPATNVELAVTGSIVRLGRSIAFLRADIVSSLDDKLVVTSSGTYALFDA